MSKEKAIDGTITEDLAKIVLERQLEMEHGQLDPMKFANLTQKDSKIIWYEQPRDCLGIFLAHYSEQTREAISNYIQKTRCTFPELIYFQDTQEKMHGFFYSE